MFHRGIGPLDVISAQNMDNVSEDEIKKKVQQAIKQDLLKLGKSFNKYE